MNCHFMPQRPFASILKGIVEVLPRSFVAGFFVIWKDFHGINFKMALALTPFLIALLLPGCAVLNPNVTLTRPDSTTKQYTPAQGIEYAEDAIKEYDYHISSNNWFRGTTGILMIGASAAALALGITDGGTTAITALGVSGASLFGIGTFLSDSSRTAIYNEGKEKIVCAIAAAQPLFLPPGKITEFEKALTEVKTKIPQVQKAIDTALGELEKVKDDPTLDDLLKRAADRIQSANSTITAAEAAYEAGIKLNLQLFRAGNTLITAVDGINAEVNKRLNGTVSSLEAANTIIGGLATVSTRLSMIPKEELKETAKAALEQAELDHTKSFQEAVEAPSPGKGLSDALNVLVENTVSLGREVAFVATIVAEIEPSSGNLGQCKLKLEELTLTVKPESIEFTKGTAGTRRLIILTGKKPFAAQLLENPVEGLTIEQPVPFGSTVEVKATNEVTKGEYTIHVVDGAERHVFIKVEVKEPVEEIKKKAKAVEDKAMKTPSQSQTKPNGEREKPNSGKSK